MSKPLLIENVRDIAGLYLSPPEHAVVFCVDENPQIRAFGRTQPPKKTQGAPLLPLGLVKLLEMLDSETSRMLPGFDGQRRAVEFRRFLETLDKQVPRGLDVHIIMDNHGHHCVSHFRTWLAEHSRFYLHLTPTAPSSAW